MKRLLITLLLAFCLTTPVIADAAWRHRASYDYEVSLWYITHPNGDRWYYVCTYTKTGGHCGWKKS